MQDPYCEISRWRQDHLDSFQLYLNTHLGDVAVKRPDSRTFLLGHTSYFSGFIRVVSPYNYWDNFFRDELQLRG